MYRSLLLATCAAFLVLPIAANAEPDSKRAAQIEAMWKAESLGGLRCGSAEEAVVKLLGKPEQRGKVMLQEADGNYVQQWDYPAKGIELTMSSGAKKSGTKTIFAIIASSGCTLATQKGIKIGSAENAVRKAYGAFEDRERKGAGELVVSVNNGEMWFSFKDGKVDRMAYGPGPE